MSRGVEWWDRWFVGMAQYISTASKDPSTKVGAVIVDQYRRVVSVGYNGFPKGVEDTADRLNDRSIKYQMIVHGERNALLFASQSLRDCCVYTYPFMPCPVCSGMIIQSGITSCVAPRNDNPRWADGFNLSLEMFSESGVNVRLLEGYTV